MMSRFVNGGYAVNPRLTMVDDAARQAVINGEPLFDKIPVADAHLKFIQQSLYDVVNHRTGTAYTARVNNPRFGYGGKTGTGQVRNITEQERTDGLVANHLLAWEKRDHALFIGYAPITNPRWAISVVVEHGGSGSIAAAPIARDVMINVQRLYNS